MPAGGGGERARRPALVTLDGQLAHDVDGERVPGAGDEDLHRGEGSWARSSTVRCGAGHRSGSRRLVVRRRRVVRALTEMRVATRSRSRNASAGTATGSTAP